jgi:hypothetical protein
MVVTSIFAVKIRKMYATSKRDARLFLEIGQISRKWLAKKSF